MKKKICIVLIIFVCIILAYGIHYLKTPVDSQVAERIIEDVYIEADAVFVREEDVYSAPGSGYVYYSYVDGERIKKGVNVANVYAGVPTDSQLKQLATIDRKIKSILYTDSNSVEVDTNPDRAESRVDEYRRAIIASSYGNDIASAARYKTMINAVRAGENADEYVETQESLASEREALDAEIGFEKYDIYSEHSGVFTTVLDGLEKVLTPEHIDNISIDELGSVYNVQSKSTEKNVTKGNAIFKIVNNHEWYVLMVVENSEIEKYEAGKIVDLSFDNIPGEITEGKIMSIRQDDVRKDKALLFIRCQKYLEGAYSFRESRCKIIFDSYEGFKVPTYAIRIDGDSKSVVAKKNNRTDSYPVDILYTNTEEGYAIVDSLKDSEKKLDDVDYIVIGER